MAKLSPFCVYLLSSSFFSFKSLQIVNALISSFLTAFHNSKVEKENRAKQNKVVKGKKKGIYGNQIWKNIIIKWKHSAFPHTHVKNLVCLVFPCPKNKRELHLTDLYCLLSVVQCTSGHICAIMKEYASSFLFRELEAHDF